VGVSAGKVASALYITFAARYRHILCRVELTDRRGVNNESARLTHPTSVSRDNAVPAQIPQTKLLTSRKLSFLQANNITLFNEINKTIEDKVMTCNTLRVSGIVGEGPYIVGENTGHQGPRVRKGGNSTTRGRWGNHLSIVIYKDALYTFFATRAFFLPSFAIVYLSFATTFPDPRPNIVSTLFHKLAPLISFFARRGGRKGSKRGRGRGGGRKGGTKRGQTRTKGKGGTG
jgi:hypothetical protein